MRGRHRSPFVFFFNDTATTEIYTLSLHDALPISLTANPSTRAGRKSWRAGWRASRTLSSAGRRAAHPLAHPHRSEEHTSELQSHLNLVCRLLLEKKKINTLVTLNSSYPHCM